LEESSSFRLKPDDGGDVFQTYQKILL